MPAAAPTLPPGPRLPRALQMLGFWSRPIAFLERCRARYGSRFTVRLPAQSPIVMISDPEEIRQVFQAPPDGLHPGARLTRLRDLLTKILEFGENPLSLLPTVPAPLRRIGPLARLERLGAQADRLIFELIDERRALQAAAPDDAASGEDVLAM